MTIPTHYSYTYTHDSEDHRIYVGPITGIGFTTVVMVPISRKWINFLLFAAVAMLLVLITLLVLIINVYIQMRVNDGGPLYLSPMINEGRIDEARDACKVRLDNSMAAAAVDSCAGYLTVDETIRSNMFIWFFPAASGKADAPILLWLQGGPHTSSLFAVFNEHGPFTVDAAGDLQLRLHTWTATHSVLYVDHPGAGYGFNGNETVYSTSSLAVIAQNLYSTLVQFFTLYPEYQQNEFYVSGESYAGKFGTAVSYAIHQNNPDAQVKINLKGLVIGNGFVDPVNQMMFSEFLYQRELINESEKQRLEELESKTRVQMIEGDYRSVFLEMFTLLKKYTKMAGVRYIQNVLWTYNEIPTNEGFWMEYLMSPSVRRALHVGNSVWNKCDEFKWMAPDIRFSVAPWLVTLLNDGQYRVLLYSGELDAMIPYQGTMNMVKALPWTGSEWFRNASSTVWTEPECLHCNNTELAGYATTYGPLTVLLIKNAGHMVPHDQPARAYSMIKRFTSGKPFY